MKSRCTDPNPDCFNCPFSDCIASGRDISRQLNHSKKEYLKEREESILEDFNKGMLLREIAEKHDVGYDNIRYIISKRGIAIKEVRKRNGEPREPQKKK